MLFPANHRASRILSQGPGSLLGEVEMFDGSQVAAADSFTATEVHAAVLGPNEWAILKNHKQVCPPPFVNILT